MSEKINNGGPAFPVVRMPLDPDNMLNRPGMSLRDWFAGQALAGMAASPYWCENVQANRKDYTDSLAEAAYAMADSMLKAREGVK